MFSDVLKESTMQVHQGVEKKLVARIKQITSVEDYITLLKLMYGFYAPLQVLTEPFIKGRHAENIIDDINYLAGSAPILMQVCRSLPEINSYHAALGTAYVTEGSTLGGPIIAGMISKKLGTPLTKGFSFFTAHGDRAKDIWAEFKLILNGSFSNAEKEEIKIAAMSAFSTFNEWINTYEPATDQQIRL